MIRQPIISVLGHVDSGKTTLLDSIRGTYIAEKEPGKITQSIGATEVPIELIKKICSPMIARFRFDLKIPGLLFIDTPGHEAFVSLRKRGSLLADMAILVIDIAEGIMPQTKESIELLKTYKVPFIIALNKIDRIPGWRSESNCFLENLNFQGERQKAFLDEKIFKLMSGFSTFGFEIDLFTRIKDFAKKVALVPVSAKTTEGLPELLLLLAGLSQQFLKDKISVKSDIGRGTVLEIGEIKGFGKAVNAIIYDGSLERGGKIIFAKDKNFAVREIKGIFKLIRGKLKPREKIYPASAAEIYIKDVSGIVPGTEFISVKSDGEIEKAKEILRSGEMEKIELDDDGIIVRANSTGSLEAVVKLLRKSGAKIKKAEVGLVNKDDILEAENSNQKLIFAFNTELTEGAKEFLKKSNVSFFSDNVIYSLIEKYEKWKAEVEKRNIEQILEEVTFPAKILVLHGHVFRRSNPAIFGAEILDGTLKKNSAIINDKNEIIGKVISIQKENKPIDFAAKGERVAISIDKGIFGRNLKEGDILYSNLTGREYRILEENKQSLKENELKALEEIKELKDKLEGKLWRFK